MDIFAEGKSLNPSVDFTWVTWPVIGTKYQGVYIGVVKNNDGYGNPQTTYLIEQPDKTVLGVGMKDVKERFHELMSDIKIGQYVGFVFSKEIETGKPNKAKIIEIVTNPSAVDTTWVGNKGINTTAADGDEDHAPATTVAPELTNKTMFGDQSTPTTFVKPVPSGLSNGEKIKKITAIATEKLGATGPEDIKAKVLENTGLVIAPANLDEILSVLEML